MSGTRGQKYALFAKSAYLKPVTPFFEATERVGGDRGIQQYAPGVSWRGKRIPIAAEPRRFPGVSCWDVDRGINATSNVQRSTPNFERKEPEAARRIKSLPASSVRCWKLDVERCTSYPLGHPGSPKHACSNRSWRSNKRRRPLKWGNILYEVYYNSEAKNDLRRMSPEIAKRVIAKNRRAEIQFIG
jgi:hypothetical protein